MGREEVLRIGFAVMPGPWVQRCSLRGTCAENADYYHVSGLGLKPWRLAWTACRDFAVQA